MTKAVLIHEIKDRYEEIELDIEPSKNEIFKLLGGRGTFIGQWPEIDVVIMKAEQGMIENDNILPFPFMVKKCGVRYYSYAWTKIRNHKILH